MLNLPGRLSEEAGNRLSYGITGFQNTHRLVDDGTFIVPAALPLGGVCSGPPGTGSELSRCFRCWDVSGCLIGVRKSLRPDKHL